MNIFEAVKKNVNIRDAAERLGMKPNHSGRVCCPFHNDHHPSMKLYDDHYYCFACGAHGDVIDLTAKITGHGLYAAAKQLDKMFITPSAKTQLNTQQQKEAQQLREKELLCFNVLRKYRRLLKDWKAEYSPKSRDEEPDSRFVEACLQLDLTEYQLDILLKGSEDDKKYLVNKLIEGNRLTPLLDRICRLRKEVQYAENKSNAG